MNQWTRALSCHRRRAGVEVFHGISSCHGTGGMRCNNGLGWLAQLLGEWQGVLACLRLFLALLFRNWGGGVRGRGGRRKGDGSVWGKSSKDNVAKQNSILMVDYEMGRKKISTLKYKTNFHNSFSEQWLIHIQDAHPLVIHKAIIWGKAPKNELQGLQMQLHHQTKDKRSNNAENM